MAPITISNLNKIKAQHKNFSCVTAYDATFTQLINEVGIETILVGDSLGMVMQGHQTTVPVSMESMLYHTQCVARANRTAFILADMPFMSYADKSSALKNAATLMQSGAHMIKMEGGDWLADIIETLVRNGIPVCAHIGLLPQSINTLGGYKVQGKTEEQINQLTTTAKTLEQAGSQILLMECVVNSVATQITDQANIPTIGIGSGNGTTGQVLVLHDLLGLTAKPAKFVKNFMQNNNSILDALASYHQEVKSRDFPTDAHCFNK